MRHCFWLNRLVDRPRILNTNVKRIGEEHSSVNISCVVSANPEVPRMVSWEKMYLNQWKYISTSASQFKITDDVSGWYLMTKLTVFTQKYRCKAYNGIGKAVNSNEMIIYLKGNENLVSSTTGFFNVLFYILDLQKANWILWTFE